MCHHVPLKGFIYFERSFHTTAQSGTKFKILLPQNLNIGMIGTHKHMWLKRSYKQQQQDQPVKSKGNSLTLGKTVYKVPRNYFNNEENSYFLKAESTAELGKCVAQILCSTYSRESIHTQKGEVPSYHIPRKYTY